MSCCKGDIDMIDEKEVREFFPSEMRDRMNDTGLRPYHMSYLCQCKQSAINDYLQGSCLPNLWSLVLMAECLDCSVNELFGINTEELELDYEKYLASEMFNNQYEFAHCVSDRIMYFITFNGMNVDEFSKQSGINKDTLKRWTNQSPKLPRVTDLLRICNALRCTPSDLLGY
jgi:DNA-binding Xre family transcriptional regulator